MSQKLTVITLTGADEKTDIGALINLAKDPAVEIGILLSLNPKRTNRYPGLFWMLEAAGAIHAAYGRPRCAIHVCGTAGRLEFLGGAFKELMSHVARVQVNGQVTPEELLKALDQAPYVITQHTASNEELSMLDVPRHGVLVDDSGGRGVSPLFWRAPAVPPAKAFGFAGGLGPDNLASQMVAISDSIPEGSQPSWVDMETKIRTKDDWFSIGQATLCVEKFRSVVPLS